MICILLLLLFLFFLPQRLFSLNVLPPFVKWALSPAQAWMKNVVTGLMLGARQSLKKHSSTRADRVEQAGVVVDGG